MRRPRLLYVIAMLAAGVVSTSAQTKPTPKPAPAKVTLPPAIDAAFKKAFPNAVVKSVSKEGGEGTEKGKTVYEVESMDGRQRRDLIYRADGSVVLYEEAIPESSVPAVVMSALKAKYPKATISLCEKLFQNGTMNYEFGLKGAKVGEVILTPEGKWVSPK